MVDPLRFLEEQKIDPGLIKALRAFRDRYEVESKAQNRLASPMIPFYGKDILEMAIAGLLEGENLLLSGPKATGKNILAENLAYAFGRPVYNVSFHVNTNSADLIGTDTFIDNEVRLRQGSISLCARYGGFGILDEINMAKNDAVSVLHATLDFRRSIDVPGYDKIDLHPAARFIGTMNYGYAGTKELNEALVSRFLVIDMPPQTQETLYFIFEKLFPGLKEKALEQFIGVFLDLQMKSANGEISTKALDLRGLLAAVKIVQTGLAPAKAVRMGIVNKTFDIFEKEIVEDTVNTRIPEEWTREDVYEPDQQ
ncbi:MAG: AAA family ATPase [Blautia sp.]|nr:AAA family ATPase [Blautia sp.]